MLSPSQQQKISFPTRLREEDEEEEEEREKKKKDAPNAGLPGSWVDEEEGNDCKLTSHDYLAT